jgi:hypothetical protein
VQGGVWQLDACPCGANCLVPDPYTLTMVLPDAALLPDQVSCPKIEMVKNADCEVESIVIRDLDDGESPQWVGSHAKSSPASLPQFTVEATNGTQCVDYQQYALHFSLGDDSLNLSQGQGGMLGDDWQAENESSMEDANGDAYSWILKR